MAEHRRLIAQITDTHIGTGANLERLDLLLDRLGTISRRPDLLLVTGDLVEHGDEPSYRLLREQLSRCPFPAYPCLGNHDRRNAFSAVFDDVPTSDGFIQYAIEAGPIRLLVLDTLEEGRHGGNFCDTRANWLCDRLAEAPDRPTAIVLHHPPVETGIEWLTTRMEAPWLARLDEALEGHHQVVALISGHVHRPIATMRDGRGVIVCPSSAPPLALDLSPIDPERPDGRALVTNGPPGMALHLWQDGRLLTHFDFADDRTSLAVFDEHMQPLIRQLISEAP